MATQRFPLEELRWQLLEVSSDGVELGPNQHLPQHFTARLSHPGWGPTRADVTVWGDPERGPVLTGLVAMQFGDDRTSIVSMRDMQAILTETIDERRLLRELAADAVGYRIELFMRSQEPPDSEVEVGEHVMRDLRIGDMREAMRSRAYGYAEPRRRRLLTRDYLQRVATVYREALVEGRPPTVAVAETFGVSHSNASKYVKKARDQKLLGPAKGTRAGEGDM